MKSIPQPDGLALLRESHLVIENFFAQYESLQHPAKKQLCLMALCERLAVHIELLTFCFYPAVIDSLSAEEYSAKFILNHIQFKQLISEIGQLDSDSSSCDLRVDALKACFQFHVTEQETVVFPKLRAAAPNLAGLGAALERERRKLEEEMSNGLMALSAQVAIKDVTGTENPSHYS